MQLDGEAPPGDDVMQQVCDSGVLRDTVAALVDDCGGVLIAQSLAMLCILGMSNKARKQ